MRQLYLIRHGRPRFGLEGRRCIGKTGHGLSETGFAQAMAGDHIPVELREELWEMDVGEWEALTFDEIRARYPARYAAREKHPGTVPPPGGESIRQAGERMRACINDILTRTRGDIAVVTHGGVNRGALCKWLGKDPDEALSIPQPWGGISVIDVDGDRLRAESVGEKPDRCPPTLNRKLFWRGYLPPYRPTAPPWPARPWSWPLRCPGQGWIPPCWNPPACSTTSPGGSREITPPGARSFCGGRAIPRWRHWWPPTTICPPTRWWRHSCCIWPTSWCWTRRGYLWRSGSSPPEKKCRTSEALAVWQKRLETALSIAERYHLGMR